MFERIARAVLAQRLAWAVALAIVFVGLASGGARLGADFSIKAFFGANDPELDYLNAYQAEWGPDDNMLLVVVRPEEGSLMTPPRLRALQAAIDDIEGTPNIARVQSITNVARLDADEPGMIDVQPVLATMPEGDSSDDPAFVAWRDRILASSLFVPFLVSQNGDSGALVVEFDKSSDDVLAIQPLVRRVRGLLESHQGREGLTYAAAGIPAIRADFFQRLIADQQAFLPFSATAIFILLFITFRRFHGVVTPALAAAIPVMMVLGVMGYAGEPIGVLNQSYMTVLPSIAVADAIHMVSRFHEEARRRLLPDGTLTPEMRREAIRAAVGQVGGACALTSLTTGIGFASLYAAEMPILNNYGLYAALGIAFAYSTVLLVVPLALSVSRGSIPEAGHDDRPTIFERVLSACARLSVNRSGLVLLATLGLAVITGYFGSKVVADNKITVLLSPTHPTSRASALIDRDLAGLVGVEIDLVGDQPNVLEEPKVLEPLLELERWARRQPNVRMTTGPASYVATLNEIVTGTSAIPNSRAGVAQLLLLAESDDRVDKIFNGERSRGRMQIRVPDPGGIEFARFCARVQEAIDRLPSNLLVKPHLTGVGFVAYQGVNRVTRDLRDSLLVAFVIIGLIIGLLFRDLTVGVICFVPNALPLLAGYGFLGMMDWLLDPSPAVVFTLALGIAVDDTIHLLVRVREEQSEGRTLEAAIENAILHSGRAVTITSVILCVGFGVYAFSSFPTLVMLGGLGAVVIFTALLCDLFVLPALLARYGMRMKG